MARPVQISVILPVHNVGLYLAECLDSLLAQRYGDFEVIIVENGSTDDTNDIIDRYVRRHRRFRVAHSEEGGGVSAARNLGLDLARGEFIAFIDGDDHFTPNALRDLHHTAIREDADVVVGDYVLFDDIREWHIPEMTAQVRQAGLDRFDTRLLRSLVLWNKLIRRSIIESNGLRMAHLRHSEDAAFLMDVVFASERIAAVDSVVYRYRRRGFTGPLSAVQSISLPAHRDIVEAYRLIRASALAHLEPDADPSGPVLAQWSTKTRRYVDDLLRKEVFNLLNQQYRQSWFAEEGVVAAVCRRIEDVRPQLELSTWCRLVRGFRELRPGALPERVEEMLASPLVTVAAYSDRTDHPPFLNLLESLSRQKFPRMAVFIPRGSVTEPPIALRRPGALVELDAPSKAAFYDAALAASVTEYVLFAEADTSYQPQAVLGLWQVIDASNRDFTGCPACCLVDGKPRLPRAQAMAYGSADIQNDDAAKRLDLMLGNKLFRRSFLNAASFCFSEDSRGDMARLYAIGYFKPLEDPLVIVNVTEEEFESRFVSDAPAIYTVDRPRKEQTASDRFVERAALTFSALTKPASDERREMVMAWVTRLARFVPTRRTVFFYSARSNGRLVDSPRRVHDALDPRVRRFVARSLPHPVRTEAKIRYHMATAKVIVVDDYDPHYLARLNLRRDQRVVQLWHACGAFKHFGLDGSVLTYDSEIAAHRQYSAVLVSSEEARRPYASAFGVGEDRVLALGVPRTDLFFDPEEMARTRAAVFDRYPRLRDKQVLLYAPTFRDHDADRSRFNPQIDFADLSASLRDDQVLVISRHIAITEKLLGRSKYENVIEVKSGRTAELMLVADLLISDYSTVIFEYALLGQPFALYCPDLDRYDRGFYVDFPHAVPAPLFTGYPELRDYLARGEFAPNPARLATFMAAQMSACDGRSTERAVALINDYLAQR